jgi:methionine synthase II (cobalamin-independent)
LWRSRASFLRKALVSRWSSNTPASAIDRSTLPPRTRIISPGMMVTQDFSPERLMLTSECGFGHVPIDITRAKLRALTTAAQPHR